jgi:hypothetical protein
MDDSDAEFGRSKNLSGVSGLEGKPFRRLHEPESIPVRRPRVRIEYEFEGENLEGLWVQGRLVATDSPFKRRARKRAEAAERLYRNGRHAEAMEMAAKALKADPDCHDANGSSGGIEIGSRSCTTSSSG